ncbi:MAG: hypothetical protein R2698_08640 [Microthrixaceae bacterium]
MRCWRDVRAGHDAVSTAGAAATWTTTAINGLPPVRFTANAALTGPDLLHDPADVEILAVTRENARVTNALISLNSDVDTSPGRWFMHMPWSNGCFYFDPGDHYDNRTYRCGAATVGDPTLVTAYKDSVAARNGLRINRGADALSSGYSIGSTAGGIRLGRTQVPPNHDIAELLVFDRRLTAGEQTQMEDYLQTKWATP